MLNNSAKNALERKLQGKFENNIEWGKRKSRKILSLKIFQKFSSKKLSNFLRHIIFCRTFVGIRRKNATAPDNFIARHFKAVILARTAVNASSFLVELAEHNYEVNIFESLP